MALRFLDSFDHYDAGTDMALKWTNASYNRIETGLHGLGAAGAFSKGMLFPGNTIIMESYINRINTPMLIFRLYDTNFQEQINCGYDNTGAVRVDQWGGSLLFQSTPDRIRVDTWYHFGWKVFVHRTAGTVEVRLNGETICNLTGVCTTNGLFRDNPDPYYFSGTIGAFGLGDLANAVIFDDLVVMDDVADGISDPRLPGGGGFDKFIGPVEIKVRRPNGVGLLAEWTPTPTVPNWQNVDDPTPDADATYNAADFTAVGASDLFAMENLAVDEDVVAVQSLVLAKKTQEGVAAIAKLNNDGTTTRVGPTVYQPSTYSYIHAPEPTAPDGSLWTKAKWDAIQYGYRRIV
jgi:hypothetical protein